MVLFQISDATVYKKHHLHSLIQTNSALSKTTNLHKSFFLGTLYLCNGGWILTVVLVLQPYSVHYRFLMCSFPWCSAARFNPLKHKKKKKKMISPSLQRNHLGAVTNSKCAKLISYSRMYACRLSLEVETSL